jgi:hypothetical protein
MHVKCSVQSCVTLQAERENFSSDSELDIKFNLTGKRNTIYLRRMASLSVAHISLHTLTHPFSSTEPET